MCGLQCTVKSGYFYCSDTGERCPMGLFDKPFGQSSDRTPSITYSEKETETFRLWEDVVNTWKT